MHELKVAIEINASIKKVWQVLGDNFEHIGDWAGLILDSYRLDSTGINGAYGGRVCLVRGMGETHEEIIYIDREKYQFAYKAIKGLPFFIRRAENHWSLQELSSQRVMVTSAAQIEFTRLASLIIAPFFGRLMYRVGIKTMEELKYFVENEKVHPRKTNNGRFRL